MRAIALFLPVLAIASTSACTYVDRQDFQKLMGKAPIEMSQDGPPKETQPLGLVYAERSGFYLFGYLPIVRVEFDNTLPLLIDEARALNADGVSNIKIDYSTASFIGLSDGAFLVAFPWTCYMKLSGMAWRYPKK